MPEGVECRVIAEQLNNKVSGKNFLALEVVGGRYIRVPDISFQLVEAVLPLKVLQVQCKGKFIYWEFENEWYLWNTLGMTGGWSINTFTSHKTLKLTLDTDNYYFNDIRHFGTIKFVHGRKLLNNKLLTLGPDMLSNPPNDINFRRIVRNNNSKTLAEILMNQKNFSGVGNYIKAEALYRAKISPWRKANTLSDQALNELLNAVISVMQESYQLQGTTLANYKDLLGEEGGFSNKLQVYGKITDPHGNKVITDTTPDNRTSWWVPELQK